MFEYTSANHFKFGYNGINHFQFRNNTKDQFSAEYGIAQNKYLNWRQANQLAAREIYEKKVGDITILLSGGMDSEICLMSFAEQNLTFKAVTLRFTDIDQSYELVHVERLKKQYGLKHEYFDLNVLDFIDSDSFYSIIDPIKCVSPIIACQLWLADQVSGTPVIAQGEVHLKKDVPSDYIPGESVYPKSNWYLYESERLCSIYQHFIQKNKPAIPGFFQYLPEQFLSYLTQNPILDSLVNDRVVGKLGTRTSKNLMSQQYYPEIPMREKRHGWESVQTQHDDLRAKLAQRFPSNDENWRIEYKKLVQIISGAYP